MAEPLRLGILSTARINRRTLAPVRETPRVDVVAVASRVGKRAEAYAREHGITRAHGSYEALLADPEVDAVYLPLPNSLHVEWSPGPRARGGLHVPAQPADAVPPGARPSGAIGLQLVHWWTAACACPFAPPSRPSAPRARCSWTTMALQPSGNRARRGREVERVDVETANSYLLELEDFARAVAGEGEPLLGRDDAVGQARALGALRRSAVEGEVVRV